MYAKNYLDVTKKGLDQTKFKLRKEEVDAELFFDSLIVETEKVQQNNGRIFMFGNGASAAISNHMALDWSKNGKVLSLSLSDSAMMTALANDYSFDGCFLEFLKINKPTKNDLIVTTSSSGNSGNIVKVLEYCKKNELTTFALSGLNEGNQSTSLADFSLYVPVKTYGLVECIHQLFHHLWLDKFMKIEEWAKTESQNMDASNFKL